LSDEHVVAVQTEDGGRQVRQFRCVRRFPLGDGRRWSRAELVSLSVLPWRRRADAEEEIPQVSLQPPVVRGLGSRNRPFTPGCTACRYRGHASTGKKHSVWCNKQFEAWKVKRLKSEHVQEEEVASPEASSSAGFAGPTHRLREKTTVEVVVPSSSCPAVTTTTGTSTSAGVKRPASDIETLDREAHSAIPETEDVFMDVLTKKLDDFLEVLQAEVWDTEDDSQRFVSDLGCWCSQKEIDEADLRELCGLYDGYDMFRESTWAEVPKDSKVVDTRMVRRWKGDQIKSRLVARDFKHKAAEGGAF
jgi:hypothetical protein